MRAKLSPERIVDAALALVARDGLAGLTTRRLGDALGVEAMSIYHHFPSKRHLLDALVDRAIASIAMPPAEVAPAEALRRVVHSYRAMARRHPKLYPLIALHRTNTPTGVAFLERILELIEPLAADDASLARQFRAVGYYLTGAALDETCGYAQGPSAAAPVSDAYVAAHCPRLARVAPYFQPQHWDATFALGLEALLGGLQARVAPAPARGRGRPVSPGAPPNPASSPRPAARRAGPRRPA